jgi:Winged helix DNA-binding domain
VRREAVVALRLARHHLAERLPAGSAGKAAVVGLQDTPPGSAALALAARSDDPPEALDELVIAYCLRGAPLAVAREDLAIFTAALTPPDEDAAKALIGSAAKALDGVTAMDALDRVSEATRAALEAGPLARDDYHQALRERLPKELLWWCRGCGSHHVHPSLWRATGVNGVLAVVGREGRSAVFGLPPEAGKVKDPGRELVRRFLRAYGPSKPATFGAWAGLGTAHARGLWERAGELAEVKVDGKKAWLLAEDKETNPPEPQGVRLLANLDPLLAARDRELLIPDEAVRKRVWKMLGGPGTVLAGGEVVALWRPKKHGKRLVVNVEPLSRLTKPAKDGIEAEAARLAPYRGAETGEVAWGA